MVVKFIWSEFNFSKFVVTTLSFSQVRLNNSNQPVRSRCNVDSTCYIIQEFLANSFVLPLVPQNLLIFGIPLLNHSTMVISTQVLFFTFRCTFHPKENYSEEQIKQKHKTWAEESN